MPELKPKESDGETRNRIAMNIVGFGLIATLVIAVLIILMADKKSEASQLVLTGILPLVGTWVGTVLAFYFAKDNFESAARNTRETLGLTEKLKAIRVSDPEVMRTQFHSLKLASGQNPDEVTITQILTETKDYNRLPILDSKNVAQFVVHRSVATSFLSMKALEGMSRADLEKLKVADLLNDPKAADLATLIKSLVLVPKTASLADAKQAMEALSNCSDVFVTETGKATEPILGWISNTKIAKHCRAQ